MTTKNELLNFLLPHLDGNFKFNIKNPPIIGTQAVFYDCVKSFNFKSCERNEKEMLFIILRYGHEPNIAIPTGMLNGYMNLAEMLAMVGGFDASKKENKFKVVIREPISYKKDIIELYADIESYW